MMPALHDTIHAMSEPMVSHDVVGFHLLSKEVARHVKVVQSGQGADEVFAGYDWYPPLESAARQTASTPTKASSSTGRAPRWSGPSARST